MISKKYIVGHFSDIFGLYPQFLKTIWSHKNEMGVSLIKVWLLDPTKGWELIARRTNNVTRRSELSVWVPKPPGGKRGRKLNEPMTNDSVNHHYVMKPTVKSKRTSFFFFFRLGKPEYFHVPLSQVPNSTRTEVPLLGPCPVYSIWLLIRILYHIL